LADLMGGALAAIHDRKPLEMPRGDGARRTPEWRVADAIHLGISEGAAGHDCP